MMPPVRKLHASVVHGRDQRAHVASSRPPIERGDREREGDREADVAHVEQRRMEHHAGILQQRIQVAAVGRRRKQALERIRREQQEQQEAERDETHHAQHARHHLVGQVAAPERDRHRPCAQHEHPQQHRALVRAPRGGDPVLERQPRVGVGRDVDHREVVGDERVDEAAERERDEQELPRRRAAARAPSRRRCRAARRRSGSVPSSADEQQREDQREVSELGNHRWRPSRHGFSALGGLVHRRARMRLVDRGGGLGRHVVLVVLREHLGRVEHAVRADLALRDDALALLEEVGKDAGIDDGNGLRRVGDLEAHGEAVRRRGSGSSPRPARRCGTRGPAARDARRRRSARRRRRGSTGTRSARAPRRRASTSTPAPIHTKRR